MIQRILNSKNFLAVLLAMMTGTLLYFKMPWPMTTSRLPQTWNEYFLRLIALRDPWTFAGLKAAYHVMLFTTPYIGYSFLLSALYIFKLRPRRPPKPQPLPLYPLVESRNQLSLVIGEIHNPRLPIPAENPSWLIIPERGLFTGTIMIGATGSGKTAGGMYPFTDQLLGYRAADADAKASALVLEVKGDFCGKLKEILLKRGRTDDYIEIGTDSEWAYNPLYNDLEGYALAYGIASLLNNLFGKGKETFWQQAYTNLVKFIIILHQVGFGYVTLYRVSSATCTRGTGLSRSAIRRIPPGNRSSPPRVVVGHVRSFARNNIAVRSNNPCVATDDRARWSRDNQLNVFLPTLARAGHL
jgi:hypothetical protein